MPYLIAFVLAITPLYIIRFKIFSIPTTLLEISIYGVFLIGIIKWLGIRYPTKHTRLVVFVALFFLSAVISAFISPDLKSSLGALKSWFFDGLLVFLLVIFYIKTKKDFSVIIGGLSVGACLVSVIGLWQYFTSNVLPDGRITSLYIYDNVLIPSGGLSNFIALYLVPIILLQVGFLFDIANRKSIVIPAKAGIQKILFIVLIMIELFTLYLTQSFGGFLGLIAGLLIIGFYRFVYQSKTEESRVLKSVKIITIFIVVLILLIISQFNNPKFKNLLNFDNNTSSNARVQIWQASWSMIKDHPVVGVGLNNFEKVYREYVPTVVFPPLEWLVPHSHNLYLSLWLETGVLGLVSFLILIGIAIFKLARARTILSMVILASIVSILVHGFVDTPILKNDLAVVFWMLMSLSYNLYYYA